MKLNSFKPGQILEHKGDVDFQLTCWGCNKEFTVWIGMHNLQVCLFDCPQCNERNEIE